MTLSLLAYLCLLALGLTVSYEDWRRRRIRNRWMLLGLGACAALYGYMLLNSLLGTAKLRVLWLGEYYMPMRFYVWAASHACLLAAAALVSWKAKLWPAGDAKFFIVLGLLVPLVDHNLRGFPFVLFIKLMTNIFVPAGVWVLAAAALLALWKVPRIKPAQVRRNFFALLDMGVVQAMDIWPHRKKYAMYLLNIYGMFVMYEYLTMRFQFFEVLQGGLGHLAVFLVMCLVWTPLSSLLQRNRTVLVWAAGAVLVFFFEEIQNTEWLPLLGTSFKDMIGFGLLFMSIQSLVIMFLRKESEESVKTRQLRPGMILSEDAWRSLRKFWARREKDMPRRYADGLFPEDLEELRSWHDVPNLVLSVYRATPFAIWVFLGTLFTLTVSKNAVDWLMLIISNPEDAFRLIRHAWGA